MKWTQEAEKVISNVPFFVKKRIRKKVEEEAKRSDASEVGIEHVQACRRRFVNDMEDEVKGFKLETCFGPGGCPNRAMIHDGLVQKIENLLAQRNLKTFLRDRVGGKLKMHHEFTVSISDCPNACSRPQIVDVGLIGGCIPRVTDEECSLCMACVEICRENAVDLSADSAHPVINREKCLFCGQCAGVCPTGAIRTEKRGFRVLVGGKLGRHPRLGRELAGIYSEKEVLEVIRRCLDHFMEHNEKGERFGEILERTGIEPFFDVS